MGESKGEGSEAPTNTLQGTAEPLSQKWWCLGQSVLEKGQKMLGRERVRGKTTYIVYDTKFNDPEEVSWVSKA